MNLQNIRRYCLPGLLFWVAALSSATAGAANFTVVNNCNYTVYPGIFPATYANGGWAMVSNTQVGFTLPAGWIGRIWGRSGCNAGSPAVCASGQCGGVGLQCAGTTGQAGTSLAEFNIGDTGIVDWYDVSYVDGFDNPIGIAVSNSSCTTVNSCSIAPRTQCSPDLQNGGSCLSPCTKYNTDQFCCRGAYGVASTCVVADWPAGAQSYVNNIHNSCRGDYAYAYDDQTSLHACPSGSGTNYTVTFCPNGSYSAGDPGSATAGTSSTPGSSTGSSSAGGGGGTGAMGDITVLALAGLTLMRLARSAWPQRKEAGARL
jgi:hypothetical protein